MSEAGEATGARGGRMSRRTAVGAATQLGTSVSVNLGSALAGLVVPVVGAFVVVAARQLVMAAVVLPVYRPRRAHLTVRRLWPALALGVSMALMNLSFYEAVHLLGLGIAATIEFLGPLAVALVAARRLIDVACAVVAGAGVFVLTGFDGTMNVWGVILALTAAASWAAYILLTRRVALALPGLEGLTVATVVSLALLLPIALLTLDPAAIDWRVLAVLAGVGILSSAIPYSLDTFVLRRITPRLYAIITASGPVVAAVFGVLILNEHLTPVEVIAIVVVCAAAATAIATHRDPRPRTHPSPPGAIDGDRG